MKPRRNRFRSSIIFGTPVFIGFTVLISGLDAHGGDILRGGGGGTRPTPSGTVGSTTPANTDIARANAKDVLASSTRTLDAVRAMQAAARAAALSNGVNHLGKNPNNLTVNLPVVRNGLVTGGLKVAPTVATDATQWTGAELPTQKVENGKTEVTIKQTTQQALLNWETFNIGKKTTLTFDQSAGGADVTKWIAFNKINDPSGNPTQILGSIKAAGQVYIINGNGIIFGGSSEVNARSLTVSSLPINDNLIQRGLLNNPDAQFLFSGLSIPGGVDGTPAFEPPAPPASGHYGDVTVQAGAILKSPSDSGGNGGRIMLVGPNVTNDGSISAESGQTILAAGLQVAVAAHDGSDPSLRGLDVWVGAVDDASGTASNTGVIESLTASVWLAGRHVNQMGAINGSTSVNLNGRIDIKASYGAVANPNFDSTTEQGAGGPMFFNQYTGTVTLGENSVTQILPDYTSDKAVPGTALPERSQVNIEGLTIYFDHNSTLLAPNAEVAVRAGLWPYKDTDGNHTIFDANGQVESGINNFYSGKEQRFFFGDGQIYLDQSATINVAGSVDVFVPLSQSILDVKLLGPELADSPLQRDTDLRGQTLTVDIRNTGVYNGKYWIGTPLGDVTGLAGLIERNAAQLTAVGGNINLQAGSSIVVGKGSALDVSGGYFQHEGGLVKTSALIQNGKLIAIDKATPDQIYDGVYKGESTIVSEKWGVVSTIGTPFFEGTQEAAYVEGAAGGTLTMTAPSMAIDGELRGLTVVGPRQRATPPGQSTLRLDFEGEKTLDFSGNLNFLKYSPTPPSVLISNIANAQATPAFTVAGDVPTALPADRLATVTLTPELLIKSGFGNLDIVNPDGAVTVPVDVKLSAPTTGSISFSAANISIFGQMSAVGGKLSFTTYDISPSAAAEYGIVNPTGSVPFLTPNAERGLFTLGQDARLSTAALLVDDSHASVDSSKLQIIDGGSITINSYQATLATGSMIDVSGGAYISGLGKISYGKGGIISILSGKDPAYAGVVGGSLELGSTLSAYSGGTGGTLNLQASLIQVGGTPTDGVLYLDESFFKTGGFTQYSLTASGALSGGEIPELLIAAGTHINPLAESMLVVAESMLVVADPAHDGASILKRFTNVPGLRSPVSISFSTLGLDDPFTLDKLEIRGDIVLEAGAIISSDAGATVAFKGGTVTLLGSVVAPGGVISVTGASSFPLTADQRLQVTQALPTVHLGSSAVLSTAGITQLVPDVFGRRIGKVYVGGKISVDGNIMAESGALLDVSGSSGILDVDPLTLATAQTTDISGLNSSPLQLRGVATRIDSNGGLIDLTGSQMLLSDATLRGAAGGLTATGGSLSVSSGNYYPEGGSRTSADINLVVRQSGNVITNPNAILGVGLGLFDETGAAYGNSGSFSIDRFEQGAFASLSLGGKYVNASPISYGGNVDFQGPINIHASGSVILAAGGVIQADDVVNVSASYIALGQAFRAPDNPNDAKFVAFQIDPAITSNEYLFAPTFGSGRLDLQAKLIDVGTLSLQNIGNVTLTAHGGDIRGNGTLNIAGDLLLKAAQIEPTTLGKFDIFAYDHAEGAGSVTIQADGTAAAPLSAGGNLSIYASSIMQEGVLRAPLGIIRLGWDGTGNAPLNAIAGGTIATPVASEIVLTDVSITSVSAKGLQIPFGISPDGLTWIDPRGVNVTLSGLPEKAVLISGNSVQMDAGATVDLSGGGDLLATRWITGNGGSMDLLGAPSATWGGGTEYQPGALVSYNGATWSARVRSTGQTPGSNLYWSKVQESYAIVPGYGASFAPYAPFNTGSQAGSLAGNPGYVSGSLKIGDTITLDASSGLPAGTYTLLPRAYAVLKGAFLVTPLTSGGAGDLQKADGSSYVSGYVSNDFNQTQTVSPIRSRFELASAAVVNKRVTYTVDKADEFIVKAGGTQLLPGDAGYALLNGSSMLRLDGALLTAATGRGAEVDISSLSDIKLTGVGGDTATATQVALQTNVLDSWNVASLLIGGIRSHEADGTTTVDVHTTDLTLDNPNSQIFGSEIVLASRGGLTLTAGSSLASTGTLMGGTGALTIAGDGTLLRVSADPTATITRTGLAASTAPMMSIGAGVNISGESVLLDSTYGTSLSSQARIVANHLTLGSGQISVQFDNSTAAQEGTIIENHLNLAELTLANVQQVKALTLHSYSSIDFYGAGHLGGPALDAITLSSNGVRGYRQGGGEVVIKAMDVYFENPTDSAISSSAAVISGTLKISAETIHLGANHFAVSGYANLSLRASDHLSFDGSGSFNTDGALQTYTPLIVGTEAASYIINAGGAVSMVHVDNSSKATSGLGASLTIQGSAISADTDILLQSGSLTLRATDGPVEVGGNLSVAGALRTFNDLLRYSDAGNITLDSATGNVILATGSSVSVAAEMLGGNAGTLAVIASLGTFINGGTLHGQGSAGQLGSSGGTSGTFLLDVGSLGQAGGFETISSALDHGGFHASRDFRIRTGDVMISNTNISHEFSLSTDQGSITVAGTIDASGLTGGSISLAAHNNLTLVAGSNLSVAGQIFDSAGKGGSILLESGTQRNGAANESALLNLQTGSTINLGVGAFVAGNFSTPGSSAFEGKFTGTLHLRAPRTAANDVRIAAIGSTITGASAIVAEGFKVYNPADGVLNIFLRDQMDYDSHEFVGAAGVGNTNEKAILKKLDAGKALGDLLVLSPGVEIVNSTGDLVLGAANNSDFGSTDAEALAGADWDLSKFRYGSHGAPGILTLRAAGDVVFNNALSDGFTSLDPSTLFSGDSGHSLLWLAPLMTATSTLPLNTQSWSYRLTAGADMSASNFRNVLPTSALDLKQPGKGSVIVGEFYPAVPNGSSFGLGAAVGSAGQTADSIRISTTTFNLGTRFEVVRTGTGDIAVNAGRDVQLRNQFSTIYTVGVALPNPTTVYGENDFVVPVIPTSETRHPRQDGGSGTLGAVQQLTQAAWSMSGGNVSLQAQANIGHYTMLNGILTVDSSRQMPTNWLYRRGYVDPATGRFANNGGFSEFPISIIDAATSTTWWIDFSNFFQGVGALGGGNVNLTAGGDVVNLDAVAPTNARMPGRMKNPDFVAGSTTIPEYLNLAADASKLLEWGGGDVTVKAGNNIDGGVYYVEKGTGSLFAGGSITTNAARSPSIGALEGAAPLDSQAWLPTTLFVGKSHFDVAARGNVLLGPVSNPFLLPQGINNRYWYKTYFNTYSADAGVNVASYGGDLTWRNAVTLADASSARAALDVWYNTQNFFAGDNSAGNASNYQPWLRLAELGLETFSSVFKLSAPNLRATSFSGDLKLAGSATLFPSASGNLELAATGGIIGLQDTGLGNANGIPTRVWTYSSINLSDADPHSIPGVATPLAYQAVVGTSRVNAVQSSVDILQAVSLGLNEVGSTTGLAGTSTVKQALHDEELLHSGDLNPVRIYATGGDLTGLRLFSPKATRITACGDISDVAFYLQNLSTSDISLVSAGRDIIPFNENAAVRTLANNSATGNLLGDTAQSTAVGNSTNALAGDIQINGPGVLEILSGRNTDLGTGANFTDGTGVGITSIGNVRNPYLPFGGADLITLAGVSAADGIGAAFGLAQSSLDIAAFTAKYPGRVADLSHSEYLKKLGWTGTFDELSADQQAIVVLEDFYHILRDTGRNSAKKGNYNSGTQAIHTLFGKSKPPGDIITQARDIRTTTGGSISLGAVGGNIIMANSIFGNPLTPPGVVTEYGGSISTFTDKDVLIGQARIFTLRGGDIMMWSSAGNIAAGTAPKTVVTAPPTRVVIDISSANVQTDLGGLATGGGIGVLASVEGVKAGNVDLIAPKGFVDAGDAGIRVTGNLNISAQVVLNSGNISVGGSSTGAAPPSVAAPSISAVTSASTTSAPENTITKPDSQQNANPQNSVVDALSIITVEVIGYGGGGDPDEDEKKKSESNNQ